MFCQAWLGHVAGGTGTSTRSGAGADLAVQDAVGELARLDEKAQLQKELSNKVQEYESRIADLQDKLNNNQYDNSAQKANDQLEINKIKRESEALKNEQAYKRYHPQKYPYIRMDMES